MDRVQRNVVLTDVLATGLRVIFVGQAAGDESAKAGTYYADPRNRFWQALESTGLTSRRLRPSEFRELLSFSVGLTDVAKYSQGRNAPQSDEDVSVLLEKIRRFSPRVVAFNGKEPAEAVLGRRRLGYGLQPERIGESVVYVLPSTSGINWRWKPTHWQELADFVAQRRGRRAKSAPDS